MNLRCIIVDDEPIARQIIKKYISEVPYLTLVGTCKNAFEAMQFLKSHAVEIMFLDINMPKLSGLNFLRTIKTNTEVIITSAYPEFAIEGFELSVTDYLLKPFSLERFIQAIMKIQNRKSLLQNSSITKQVDTDFIFIKNEKKIIKLDHCSIDYIEAYGNYIKLHAETMILVPQALTDFLKKLPNQFIRIHKSYVVNFNKLKLIEGNRLMLKNNIELPIGRSFKKSITRKIDT